MTKIATHHIQEISFSDGTISILVDGKTITLPLDKVSIKLKLASDLQRSVYKISPSGYGIHWPLLDEDISIAALLKSNG